jgi:hypothetical protein
VNCDEPVNIDVHNTVEPLALGLFHAMRRLGPRPISAIELDGSEAICHLQLNDN